MPRTAREDFPGAIHHVVQRGIERRHVFVDDEDRRAFVDRLALLVHEMAFRCYAWALMPNHFHLLLRTGPAPLGKFMQRLTTWYALYFNRRHRRAGHLFQNRYKPYPVRDDATLIAVLRYVHLNPVVAGLLPDMEALDADPWTGHGTLIGRRPPAFETADEALSHFGKDQVSARRALRAWMAANLSTEGAALPLTSEPTKPPRRLTGDSLETLDDTTGPRVALDAAKRWAAFEGAVAPVAKAVGVVEREVRAGRRTHRVAVARSVLAHLALDRLALPGRETARRLGVSPSALPRAARRGRAILPELGVRLPEALHRPVTRSSVRRPHSSTPFPGHASLRPGEKVN